MSAAADATVRVVERFRAHGLPSCASLGFEQSDMAFGLEAITDETAWDWREGQVLVRHNVDGEDLAIVYVDGPTGPPDDLALLDAVIAVLQDARRELGQFMGADR
ncbi:hypothetical protein [Aeromicrobium sp.]|uniref:hypothetical protein n=1 Tax=Aeromicrobium sp. TaxID=1871063 RepID=UPI0030C2F728